MGHNLTGFIVEANRVPHIASEHPQLRAVRLHKGLALFPLPGQLLDTLCPDVQAYPFPELRHLCADLANLLMNLSRTTPILYFETEYVGGVGNQAAILFRDGHVDFGPEQHWSDKRWDKRPKVSPINEALERMGVRVESPHVDAFESVGLSEYRDTGEVLDLDT